MKTNYRTHTCGALRKEHVGEEVTLSGWADTIRVQGKIGFILIRDRYGITQIFVPKDIAADIDLPNLRKESVIKVQGLVNARPENQVRAELSTGEVELKATAIEVLSTAQPLPLDLDDESTTEETRMKYRFLDLRTKKMQENIITRHKIVNAMHEFLHKHDFLEIETPFLAKSTPEGARDYLVPSRVNNGSFYALPQSPQLFKQLLMISGFDRYAQIVKCFRDEDLRSDRQPEFTQLDMELSFVEEEDVISIMEGLIAYIMKEVKGIDVKLPLPRMSYDDAMTKYGNDRPDMRKEWNTEHALLWVVDFPMFDIREEDGKTVAMHHPFTQPTKEGAELIKEANETGDMDKLKEVKSHAYDLVLNGSEIAGGSIRNHNLDVQKSIFDALGLKEEEYKEKFGFLLDALSFGAPPHGGMAFGLDRLAAILTKSDSIREVIAFPKNKDARDLMLDAPSEVAKEQLDELGLDIKK